MKHSSKLESGGRMNENAIHGLRKKGRMEDCLEGPHIGNHETQLQTRKWKTHERKRNSWSSEKGEEWRIALRVRSQEIMKHSSKLESGGHMNENEIHGAPKKGENRGLP